MSFKISGGVKENGIVVGNIYDKYGVKNPAVKLIMKKFESNLAELITRVSPSSINEIGCGEGYWVIKWNVMGIDARGCDISNRVIEIARHNASAKGLSSDLFNVRSIYDLEPGRDSADLIVCCEVLEHLEFPEAALKTLQKIAGNYLIVSVPREPVWRILNMIRLKYVSFLGNTPGHIQHWSTKSFVELVKSYFQIVKVKTPLPWTMILCRLK